MYMWVWKTGVWRWSILNLSHWAPCGMAAYSQVVLDMQPVNGRIHSLCYDCWKVLTIPL